MSNCSITVHMSYQYIYSYDKRNILPSKEQVLLSYFIVYIYVYICMYFLY